MRNLIIPLTADMINEITLNSTTAIELSRTELLQWLNDILGLSLSKIEQLGTGIAYCQLLDHIYPGKVQINKVNAKAKHEYEYVNNFKVLQQSFSRLNILKHIEVEKLVKCKYQDNLEFLQWFKKLHDYHRGGISPSLLPANTSGTLSSHNVSITHANSEVNANISQDSQNTTPTMSRMIHQEPMGKTQVSFTKIISTPLTQIATTSTSLEVSNILDAKYQQNTAMTDISNLYPILTNLQSQSFNDEKMFYSKKFMEIEELFETWDRDKLAGQLIDRVRGIIMKAEHVKLPQSKQISKFLQV